MKIRRSAFVVLVLLLLSTGGCSMVTFGYDHADWMMRHWISDYASFNAAQQAEIRRDVDAYLAWHRQHALPEYIAFLQKLYVLVDRDRPLTAPEVAQVRAELGRLYRLTLTPLVQPAAHVLATLNRAQIDDLAHTLAARSSDARKEMLPGNSQENLAARAKFHVKFAEGLVGNLSRAQEAQVTALSLRIPFVTEDYLKERALREAALIALLNTHPGEDKIAAFLTDWFKPPELPRPPQEQQTIDAYDRAMNDMLARTYWLLTDEQRKHLLVKIARYIDAFQHLHGEASPTALTH